jgi:hypothetical protein
MSGLPTNSIHYAQFDSPLGSLLVTASGQAIHHILICRKPCSC